MIKFLAELKCPECYNTEILERRSVLGIMFCSKCNFTVKNKSINNPFVFKWHARRFK